MSLKKKVMGLIGGITLLAGCSTFNPQLHGSLDLAYVPMRTDDHVMENEFKTELEIRIEQEMLNGVGYIGGISRTYMQKTVDDIFFDPSRQEYDFLAGLRYDNIELYFLHNCSHPVQSTIYDDRDERERWITDERTGEKYYVNNDSITEIGVKLRF
ncbi:MAG: hypothetical protein ACE5RP_00135 [Nitrosopumilus sp.]